MHSPKLVLKKSKYVTPFFIFDRYKNITIDSYFTYDVLKSLWLLFKVSQYTILIKNFKNYNKFRYIFTNNLHNIWLVPSLTFNYTFLNRNVTSLHHTLIIIKGSNKTLFKNLYITTCCYNINQLTILHTQSNKLVFTNSLQYFLNCLYKTHILNYWINWQYLKYFNKIGWVFLINLKSLETFNFFKFKKSRFNYVLISSNLLRL